MKLGYSPYLNALPLSQGLDALPGVELTHASPARLSDLLREGLLDAALVSSSELFSGDYRVIPGGALSSSSAEADAVLYANLPYTHLRNVALSAASRSTNLLLRVLLHRLCPGLAVRYELRPEDALRSLAACDACLLIGDGALVEQEGAEHRYGLAQLWYEHTNLPMVFSLWLTRPDADPAVVEVVQEAMRRGQRELPQIAARAAAARGLKPETVRRYLLETLDYNWTSQHLRSLEHFCEELAELGLIQATRPILCYGENAPQPAAPVETSHGM